MVFQGLRITSMLCSRKYERAPVDDMFINPRVAGKISVGFALVTQKR